MLDSRNGADELAYALMTSIGEGFDVGRLPMMGDQVLDHRGDIHNYLGGYC